MANLPLLALPSELAVLTGRSAGDQRLVAAIVDASRRFRSAVKHQVSLVEDDVIELDGSGGRVLLLPGPLPVISISSVLLDDAALEHKTDYRFSKTTGVLRRSRGRVWPAVEGIVQVTYTHGYDATPAPPAGDQPATIPGLPEDIQGAVLGLAQVLLVVTPGVQSKTVLGDTVAFGAAATVGATQEWVDAVENYRLSGDRA